MTFISSLNLCGTSSETTSGVIANPKTTFTEGFKSSDFTATPSKVFLRWQNTANKRRFGIGVQTASHERRRIIAFSFDFGIKCGMMPSEVARKLRQWPSPPFRLFRSYDCSVQFTPQPLRSKPVPFDHPDYLYELKYDGFRALAYIDHGRCRLVSRNGTTFASFSVLSSAIGSSLTNGTAVLDGEIACVDEDGCPQFNDLLFHRAEPCFFAFDILARDGRDLRFDVLIDRKAELRRLLASRSLRAQKASRVCYVDYVERTASALFDLVCQRDLEGIVAKLKHGNYATEREHSTWIKVKNKKYSQAEGRSEFFEGKKSVQSVHAGWDSSSLVCEDVEVAL
jgi:hypothetical protein